MLASICLGVVSIILAGGFIDDMLLQLKEATIHSQLGHFQVYAAHYVDAGEREPLSHTITKPRDAVAALRSIPGVRIVASRLTFPGLLSSERSQMPVIFEGVEPGAEVEIGTSIATASGAPLQEGTTGVILGEGVARTVKAERGDALTLVAPTGGGALNSLDLPLAGVFRSPFKDFDAHVVRMRLRDAQELANDESVTSIVVLLDSSDRVPEALAAARALLPSNDYDIRPWWTLADFYQGTVALYKRQFLVLEIIVSLMVVLGVANSVNMTLHERQAEFGTVRTLGYRRSLVFRQILAESALIGVIAALLGVVIGAGLALVISAVGIDMPPPPNSDAGYTAAIRVSAFNVLLAVGIGMAAAILGAMFPAYRLSRMPIVDALRHAI
jgi:putative ABC transport system permease protein